MSKYLTKQRKSLLDYLSLHADEALSAKQIAESLEGADISVSAVYRNLSALEEDNLVKRTSKAGSREVFYQYTDAPSCREKLHLSCKNCGKTYHMDSRGAESLVKMVAEQDGFIVDKSETVLFGICEDCKKSE